MDCSTVKEKGSKNVILSWCFIVCILSSFLGHFDDAMPVSVNNAGVYIKENCRIIFFNAHGFWHIGYEISCKVCH